jgi:hypothetical protein
VVFFKITNANSRDKIIESLLKKTFGNKYRMYWHGDDKGNKGIFHHLRSLAQDRNSIVHWSIVNWLDGQPKTEPGPEVGEWLLVPPNWWDRGPEKPSLSTDDLNEFAAKADFISHSIFMFHEINFHQLSGLLGETSLQSWREIFAQPCSYPPQEHHPAHARWLRRDSPSQPSQA